jgi:hypothetical protein
MRMTRWLLGVAVMPVALFLLNACSSQNIGVPAGSQPATATGLPSPQDVLRNTSATSAQRFKDASAFLPNPATPPDMQCSQRLLAVFGLPGAIMFSSSDTEATPFEGLSFAIYRFELPSYTGNARIRYYWQGNGPDWAHTWIGVGDVNHNRWEWSRMGQVGALDLGSFAGYLNVSSELVVCVLLDGKTSGVLRWLAIGDYVGRIQAVDWTGDVGRGSTMALVAGLPAIVYYDSDAGNLKYVRAHAVDGLGWYPPMTIPGVIAPGSPLTLVNLQNKPGIAYYESSEEELRFISAVDQDITGWNAPVTLDSSGQVGYEPSMVMVNGRPAVSYYEYKIDDCDLKYIRANDAQGVDWGAPELVVSAGDCRHSSLAMIGGSPAISYYDNSGHDLMYVRAADADGNDWSTPVTVFDDGISGNFNCLTEVDGRPAICFYRWDDGTFSGQLRYTFSIDNVGAQWMTNVAMLVDGDFASDVGAGTSMAVIGGVPVIAYYDSQNRDLKLARAIDAAGVNWGTPQVIDNAEATGDSPSLVNLNGFPAVAYYEYLPGANLMYQLVAE